MSKDKIIIVGAGLCGSMLAVKMAQRGFDVVVYEKRPDMRTYMEDAGRSINLALSARGLMALESAGLKQAVLDNCIPMHGRMVHPIEGEEFLSPYSGRNEDFINSVSRPGLNIDLINEAEKHENVKIHFSTSVTSIDLKKARIEYILDGEKYADKGTVVIGTDGAGSVVRRALMAKTTKLLFNYSQDFLRHGYKELTIKPTDEGGWRIHKEALHIWPNGHFMIIALPNLDGSFTVTMFHPFEGEAGFNTLNTPEKLESFFTKYYPSLIPFMPHYKEEYFENPVGTLGTIKCYPWQAFGKTLIMGDASHAVVPFYGQGMNASLEDVRVFDETIEEIGDNWDEVFSVFQDKRKQNTDAIADLAIDNFYEMRDHVDDLNFMRKRKIEMQLEQTFPDYYSKYSLVTFRPELPYHDAMVLGRKQDALLLSMVDSENFDEIPLKTYYEKLMELQ